MTDPTLEWLREELPDARERCEKATEGPWRLGQYRGFGDRESGEYDVLIPVPDDSYSEGYRYTAIDGVRGTCSRKADADFIAHARTDLPAALSVLDRIGRALAKMDDPDLSDLTGEEYETLLLLRDVALRREQGREGGA